MKSKSARANRNCGNPPPRRGLDHNADSELHLEIKLRLEHVPEFMRQVRRSGGWVFHYQSIVLIQFEWSQSHIPRPNPIAKPSLRPKKCATNYDKQALAFAESFHCKNFTFLGVARPPTALISCACQGRPPTPNPPPNPIQLTHSRPALRGSLIRIAGFGRSARVWLWGTVKGGGTAKWRRLQSNEGGLGLH